MELHPLFKLREAYTPALISLLDSAVLGTNGAHYRHLDTHEKIELVDNPLHFSIERNERLIGNISFCRRQQHWYVRYFAFDNLLQSSGQKKSRARKENLLKSEIERFFQAVFNGEYGEQVESFYAYIDPKNLKSLWMSENFGFKEVGKVATQTFSRVRPRMSNRLRKVESSAEIKELVRSQFSECQFYFEEHCFHAPLYVLVSEKDEILAFTKTLIAKWEIKRLPGKMGGVLTKVIPFVPGLNKLIRPKNHSFIVPEAVVVKDHSVELLNELFEAILFEEKLNLLIWWADHNDNLYSSVKERMKWGVLNKLVGVSNAHVVCKTNPNMEVKTDNRSIYTSGIDFI